MIAQYVVFFAVIVSCAAQALNCDVIPITQWGGSPSNRQKQLVKPVNLVVIQHTVSQECFTDSDCERIAKGIRAFQIKTLHYDDIGLSFLVGGNGKIYEGAGWRVGAHTMGYNDKSISISFVGDFRVKLPSPAALQTAQDFMKCSVDNKDLTTEYNLVGHMQLSATLSPGATLQKLIETWPHWDYARIISEIAKKSQTPKGVTQKKSFRSSAIVFL